MIYGIKPSVTFTDEDGNPFGIKQIDGRIRVSATQYTYDISHGLIPGHEVILKFGFNADVPNTFETIWTGSANYVYMSSPSTLYISSSDNTDDQDYEVIGLDANWDAQVVTVTANGNNFVALTGTWIRVFRVKNIGTTDNAGVIYISDDNTDAGGDGIPDNADSVKARIEIGYNQTLMALMSIKTGYMAFIRKAYFSSSVANKTTDCSVWVRPFGGVFQIKKLLTIAVGAIEVEIDPPLAVDAKSDIELRALVSGGSGRVSAGFDGWMET